MERTALGFEETPVVDADHGKSESAADGDAEAGAAKAEKCKKARVTLPVLSVLQTVLQHAAEALADKTKELTDERMPPP